MTVSQQIRLAELLAALSLTADLGRGFPQEKGLRTCLVAERLAQEVGLDNEGRRDTYYASLIHPVGCTSATYENARIFGTNELQGIPAYVQADLARPGELIRAMREESKGLSGGRRARVMLKNLTSGKDFAVYALRAECEAGARFIRRVGLGEKVVSIVTQGHERWDGKGLPAGLHGDELELGARLFALANQVEVFHRLDGSEETLAMVRRRRGGWFDPSVVQAFERRAVEIFADLEGGSVWDAVLEAEPSPPVTLPAWRLDDVAEVLADFVDLKSPFLLGHSSGVARLAEEAGTRLGLGEDEVTAVRRSGLLHDLGRVGVSNLVWDKPGPLTASEWEQVRLHAYSTERILATSPLLMPLSQLAGMHHERSNGSGYHRGATAAAIPMTARVLAAADVFQALSEPRPHRSALTPDDAARKIEDMALEGTLDPEAVRAVTQSAGVVLRRSRTSAPWPAGLTDREVEVLRLLARGLSKRQIAEELYISPGTVHTHTVHIYEKLDVSTRAGVALFAMEHGLVQP